MWIPFRRSNRKRVHLLSKNISLSTRKIIVSVLVIKLLWYFEKKCRIKKRTTAKFWFKKNNVQNFLVSNQKTFQDDIVCWTNFSLLKDKVLYPGSFRQLAKKKVNDNKGFKKKKNCTKGFSFYSKIFFRQREFAQIQMSSLIYYLVFKKKLECKIWKKKKK